MLYYLATSTSSISSYGFNSTNLIHHHGEVTDPSDVHSYALWFVESKQKSSLNSTTQIWERKEK